MGPEVEAFEREMASFLGVKHALTVSSGTAALHLAYLAVGIQAGDEVVQPALNFVAAANMTLAVRAVPVFADITALDEPIIDPVEVERHMTPRTTAVVVMHYGGFTGSLTAMRELCDRRGLALIEDACHALGTRDVDTTTDPPRGVVAGTVGDVACLSFFSNKNMATGEGGMLVTNRDDVAARAKALRSHGMTTLSWDRHRGHARSYDVTVNGYNYRLDELHAALGRVQLQKLDGYNARRRQLVDTYRRHLSELEGWTVPFSSYRGQSACHLMVALAPDRVIRDAAVDALRAAGIQTSLHYPCVPDFLAFKEFAGAEIPHSRLFTSRAITLPLFPTLSETDVETVCSHLKAVAHEQGHALGMGAQ
jgi:dTDP-4-amino-4,6-dideoxygalactose transaminase